MENSITFNVFLLKPSLTEVKRVLCTIQYILKSEEGSNQSRQSSQGDITNIQIYIYHPGVKTTFPLTFVFSEDATGLTFKIWAFS